MKQPSERVRKIHVSQSARPSPYLRHANGATKSHSVVAPKSFRLPASSSKNSVEIYKHIIYDGKHLWINSFPESRDRTVTICSFFQETIIPGLRLGYIFAPKEVIDSAEKVQRIAPLAPESLAQLRMPVWQSSLVGSSESGNGHVRN